MSPEISIIVPVYNASAYLDECVNSILSQTFTDFELILCPGSSTDNSTQLCHEWVKRDSRIKIVIQDKNNCAYARNKAIKKPLENILHFAMLTIYTAKITY